MKGIFKYIGLCVLPLMASCNGVDDVMYHIEEPVDNMKIQANVSEIVLDANKPEETALTFTWNEAANRGPAASIKYMYRLDLADNNFATASDLVEVPDRTVSISHDDLNDFIQKRGISPETMCEIEAEVIAQVTDSTKYRKPEISKVRVFVTGYRPVSRPLYVFNTITNTWDEMNEVVLGKEYTFSAHVPAGTGIKFSYSKTGDYPTFTMGETPDKMVRNDGPGGAEQLFVAPICAPYEVTVNTKNLTCKFGFEKPIYTEIYGAGSALPCGWDIGNPTAFSYDPSNPEIFFWEGHINVGEFKIYMQKGNWGGLSFRPLYGNTDWDGNDDCKVMTDGPDDKWNISREGDVRIELNIYHNKIKFIYK